MQYGIVWVVNLFQQRVLLRDVRKEPVKPCLKISSCGGIWPLWLCGFVVAA
jgi:hypothetical protein